MPPLTEATTLTASECAVCHCHCITTRERTVAGEPWFLCDECRSQIKPVRLTVRHDRERQEQ
jgi:hypothetical protein